jgi:hypothetical protein
MDNQSLFIFLSSIGLFGFGAVVLDTFLDVSKLVLDQLILQRVLAN